MRCSELPCVKESGFTCPGGHLLQPVISHGGSRAKGGLDIALLEQATLLCAAIFNVLAFTAGCPFHGFPPSSRRAW